MALTTEYGKNNDNIGSQVAASTTITTHVPKTL
jgi:hypothetical protein